MHQDTLRDYTLGLLFGMFMIFLAGMIASNGGLGDGMTAYAVYEAGEEEFLVKTGNTELIDLVVKDCEMHPKQAFAKAGDKIQLVVRVLDENPHRITLKEEDVSVVASNGNPKRAEFYISEPGEYIIEDTFPCKAQGHDAELALHIS